MGRTISDAVLVNATPGLTSATANFGPGDVNKTVVGSGIPTLTTIASVTNATTIVLSKNATSDEAADLVTISVTVTTAQLDSLLDLAGTIDTVRGQLLLDLAVEQCETIAMPLPQVARSIVYAVAARGYLNPSGITSETIGPSTVNFGSVGIGIYLRPAEEKILRRLAGMGGAFSVDPMPVDAGKQLYPWDLNLWWEGAFGDPLGVGGGMGEVGLGEWI